MGCGRSRHRSPSLQPDGLHKDKVDSSAKGDSSRDGRKNSAKKQKQAEKNVAKSVSKRESDMGQSGSPRRSTNGKADVRGDTQGGGAFGRRDGTGKRDWQLEEAVDTPPETVMAVYKSSVPSSTRASLGPTSNKNSSNSFSPNGSLLNGGSHKGQGKVHCDIDMPTDISPSKAHGGKEKSSKPVHITNSQLEFFRMLDEKIEKGADYSSDDE